MAKAMPVPVPISLDPEPHSLSSAYSVPLPEGGSPTESLVSLADSPAPTQQGPAYCSVCRVRFAVRAIPR